MSSIGAPPSNFSTYGKDTVGTDPYGAQDPYGMPAGGPGGEAVQTPEMQAYVQQLYYYHTMYQQMLYTATDPNQINQLRQYDAQVLQYLQEVGAPPPQEGAPFAGGDPNALTPQTEPSQYVNTPPDYQTKEAVVFEEGASSNATIDRQDPDKREANYYQPSNVCNIPSNAAMVKVTMQPDDGIEGGQMAVVEITFHNPDGTTETRIVKYHGADREGFQLAINTPSTEQVDLTGIGADFEDKIKWGQEAGPEPLKGDPPTEMDGDTRIYDGQNFEISPVPTGKDEQTTVMASGDVTYSPNSNTEYTVVSYDSATGNYVIKVYNDQEKTEPPKETITVDGGLINNINFTSDPTRIEFEPPLGKGEGNHEIDENNEFGLKLHMTGEETAGLQEGEPMNPNAPADTAVDQLSSDGKTATFNTAENVELTNYPPPAGPETVNITAPGSVTIHKNSYDDTVSVEKSGDTYTITVTDAETGKETKYIVKGPPTSIVLDFLPENISGGAENDPLIQQGTTPIDAAQMLTDLGSLSGKTPQEITSAILAVYPSVDTDSNGQISTDEINAAKASGTFPPLIPDSKFAKFLYDLDPGLKSLLDQFKTADANGRDLIIGPLRDRMVSLLGKFYSPVSAGATDTTGIDNIRIGSTEYDFMNPAVNGDAGTYKWSNDDFGGNAWDLLNFATQASQ